MTNFYLTFGQQSPLKNGWIKVVAKDETAARHLVIEQYGIKWSGLYAEEIFEPYYFPEGELGVISE